MRIKCDKSFSKKDFSSMGSGGIITEPLYLVVTEDEYALPILRK